MPETTEPNQLTRNEQSGTSEDGSLDDAAAAFAAQDQADNGPEQAPDNEPAESSNEEPGDGETEDEGEAADELVEARLDGKTYKVAPEVEKALLRQADYSRKMNEVGAKDKAFTQRLEQAEKMVEGAGKYAQVLATVGAIDAELKQLDGVDLAALEQQDPSRAALLALKVMRLQNARKDAQTQAQGIDAELSKQRDSVLAEKRADMFKALEKDLKGWGDAKGAELTKYAADHGVALETLQRLTDPGVVLALEKARKYDALQASKTAIKAKGQDAPPVLKPGAQRRPQSVQVEAMARLRKDNSQESAEAAFLSRMR